MEIRNPTWSEDGTAIRCEVKHPDLGWVPFAARDKTGEAHTQDIWDRAVAGGVGSYVPPAPTHEQVDRERERRLAAGAAFTVSWQAEPIPMTGRPQDESKLLGLLMRAQAYAAAGVTGATLTYRDAANVMHRLTPDQMIELVTAGMNWFEAVMAASWAMKDGGIPLDYADDAHWP